MPLPTPLQGNASVAIRCQFGVYQGLSGTLLSPDHRSLCQGRFQAKATGVGKGVCRCDTEPRSGLAGKQRSAGMAGVAGQMTFMVM